MEKNWGSKDEKPELEIQMILYDEKNNEKSQVAIKGTMFKVGDIVDGYEIVVIQEDQIHIEKKGVSNPKRYAIKNLS
jgi:hypothetical protein